MPPKKPIKPSGIGNKVSPAAVQIWNGVRTCPASARATGEISAMPAGADEVIEDACEGVRSLVVDISALPERMGYFATSVIYDCEPGKCAASRFSLIQLARAVSALGLRDAFSTLASAARMPAAALH